MAGVRNRNSADSSIAVLKLLARPTARGPNSECANHDVVVLERRTFEVFPQLGQGVTKDLAYTPLGQLQGFADLFEDKTLVEIESRDEPLPILEPRYGVDELGAQIH